MNKAKPVRKGKNPTKSNLAVNDKACERAFTEIALGPVLGNTLTARRYAAGHSGELDLTDCALVMAENMRKVNRGDLSAIEDTLIGQATALDSIFNELARRAALNMDGYLPAAETCLRLALKAQGQCRATLETLAEIKSPRPVAFVKQANIANGPQQVNNGEPRGAHSPAREIDNPSNELLGVRHEQRLDFGATGAAGGNDPLLEAVGTVNRSPE